MAEVEKKPRVEKLTRAYVQAHLNKLAPLNRPDKFCKWWWEWQSGRSQHLPYGFYYDAKLHTGPMSKCWSCWQARLEEYIRLGGHKPNMAKITTAPYLGHPLEEAERRELEKETH